MVRVEKQQFAVRLIPQTLADTVLSERKCGSLVNIESDIIGKYIRRQLMEAGVIPRPSEKCSGSGITMEKLREAGFFS